MRSFTSRRGNFETIHVRRPSGRSTVSSNSCGEHLAIVGVQLIRLLSRKEFAVGFADNLISTSAAELLKRKITIEVTPIRLFQENHRGTMVQNSSKLLLVFVKRFFNALAVDNFIRQISDDGCELFPPLEELS